MRERKKERNKHSYDEREIDDGNILSRKFNIPITFDPTQKKKDECIKGSKWMWKLHKADSLISR